MRGHFPQLEALPPFSPVRKNGKNHPFSADPLIFAPQKCILPHQCPPKFWCRHWFSMIRVLWCCIWYLCVFASSIHINQNKHQQFPCDVTMMSYTSKRFQKQTKTKKTRHVAVTDGVPCRLWDIYPWLTPVSLFSRKCDASVWITWIYLVT